MITVALVTIIGIKVFPAYTTGWLIYGFGIGMIQIGRMCYNIIKELTK